MTKVLVLGSSGMLGRAVAKYLVQIGMNVVRTNRDGSEGALRFTVGLEQVSDLCEKAGLKPGDYVINAVGLITHRLDEEDVASRTEAIRVNSLFPHELASVGANLGLRVIQIATDCVFSGRDGNYGEDSPHDATDLYGLTKSIGEVPSSSVLHLRCSIVGPENGRNLSLYEWVRSLGDNAKVNGYSDHIWNGVTTYAFAKVVGGIIAAGDFSPGIQHLVPENHVSKSQLVKLLASRAGRSDIQVTDFATGLQIDRTLVTNNPDVNEKLWLQAGYTSVPTVQLLIDEMPIN